MLFKVYNDFFLYKSGIYTRHPRASLDSQLNPYHAVRVLGWGTENGIDYWVMDTHSKISVLIVLITFSAIKSYSYGYYII